MVLWWCIPCQPKVKVKTSLLLHQQTGPGTWWHLVRLCTASSCLRSGWLVPLYHGSHMHLGLPHPHIPPRTTPTGKLRDQNDSESVPGVSTGWGGEELSFPILLSGLES